MRLIIQLGALPRNAAIGAAVLSYRALFYRDYGMFAFMLALGALSGVLYTLLLPFVRSHPRLHYLPWILCAYFAIGGGLAVGGLKHAHRSRTALKSPGGMGSFLLAGAAPAYAAART